MTFFMTMAQCLTYHWVYSSAILRNMLFGTRIKKYIAATITAGDVVTQLLGEEKKEVLFNYGTQVCLAIFIITSVTFAIVNCPWIKKIYCESHIDCKHNKYILYIVRGLGMLVIYLVPFVGVIYTVIRK